MNEILKRASIIAIIFICAFALGLFHLQLALRSIFVFREDEPLSSWICIISGPLSTLPATIAAIFNKKIAGIWLVLGGFISFAVMFSEKEYMLAILSVIAAPMILIGLAFLVIATTKRPTTSE